MSYRSSLSPVVLMSTVGLGGVGFLATCGANNAAADPSGSGDRLGCSTYCQNAGGYGAAGSNAPYVPIVKVASGAVRADADGYVPVTVTCVASSTCQGAIVLAMEGLRNPPDVCGGGNYRWAGCSDLLVNANSTRTIAVPLTPAALAYARANSPVTVGAQAHCQAPPVTDYRNAVGGGQLEVSAT
jgi:hypothetical protein